MTCAWSGTLAQLKKIVAQRNIEQVVAAGFETAYHRPGEQELVSWLEFVPRLTNALGEDKFDSLQVILELQMPVGAERADAVLLGGREDDKRAVVLELKQWSKIRVIPETMEVEVPGLDVHQHPSLQARNYAGKLYLFNARAHDYRIDSLAFLHNADHSDKEKLSAGVGGEWLAQSPIYVRGEELDLAAQVEESLLPCMLADDEHRHLSRAPYDQSSHLFTFLQTHAQQIAEDAAMALAIKSYKVV